MRVHSSKRFLPLESEMPAAEDCQGYGGGGGILWQEGYVRASFRPACYRTDIKARRVFSHLYQSQTNGWC